MALIAKTVLAIANENTFASGIMGYRQFVQANSGGGGTAVLWGSQVWKRSLTFKMRPSRRASGDISKTGRGDRSFQRHQNNNPDQRVPIPFTRGWAPRTDRLGARGWCYIAANVTPIG